MGKKERERERNQVGRHEIILPRRYQQLSAAINSLSLYWEEFYLLVRGDEKVKKNLFHLFTAD